MSILDNSDFLVQSLKFIGGCNFIFKGILKFIRNPFGDQPSTSFLPVIFIENDGLSQFLLNSFFLSQLPLQILILSIQILKIGDHPLRFQLPELLLIVMGHITDVIKFATFDISDGAREVHIR